jgi:hypothetical protein
MSKALFAIGQARLAKEQALARLRQLQSGQLEGKHQAMLLHPPVGWTGRRFPDRTHQVFLGCLRRHSARASRS